MVSCTGPSDVFLWILCFLHRSSFSLLCHYPFSSPTVYSLLFTCLPSSPAMIVSPDALQHTNVLSSEWTWHIKLFSSLLSSSLFLSHLLVLSLFFPSSPPFPFSSQMQTIHRKQEIMASVQSARANQRASWEKPRMRGEKQPIVWRRLKSRKDGIVWRGDKSSCCHSNLN